jgi:hypothetical protein
VTIAIRPSSGYGMARFVEVIWGAGEVEYFCGRDWTGQISLKLLRKIAQSRTTDMRRRDLLGVLPPGDGGARCRASVAAVAAAKAAMNTVDRAELRLTA